MGCTVIGRQESICYFEVESEINGKKCISSHRDESRNSSNNPYEVNITSLHTYPPSKKPLR